MNSDIRILITFRGNRKRQKLDIALGENSAGYLIDLWIGAAISRPEGVLIGWDELDIAIEANYKGDANLFIKALLSSRWIEKNKDEIYCLRNWTKRQKWAANDKVRSESASKKALRRWVLSSLPKKEHADFNAWFDAIYVHNNENNATSIEAAYKQYASSIAQHTTCNAPLPLPLPLPLPKDIYGTFENVLLSKEEIQKLKNRFNGSLENRIESLSEYMRSKGKKYSDHYATILSWDRRDNKIKETTQTTEEGWTLP